MVPTHTDCCPCTYWFTRWKLSSGWKSSLKVFCGNWNFHNKNVCHNKGCILPKIKQNGSVLLQGNCDLYLTHLSPWGPLYPRGLLLSLISLYWWCPYCRYSPGHRATKGKADFVTQLLCSALAAALTLNQLKIFPHSKTDNYFYADSPVNDFSAHFHFFRVIDTLKIII